MLNFMYQLSQLVAVAGGLVLAVPYLKQIKDIKEGKKLDLKIIKQNLPFSIAILGFTFGALMNFCMFGNLGILLAQLFSAIPLVYVLYKAYIQYKK